MRFYLDTEFKEKPHTIDLISIGIVSGDGRGYYAISKDFNLKEAWRDDWLRINVIKPIHTELCQKCNTYEKTYHYKLFTPFTRRSLRNLLRWYGKSNDVIAKEIIDFVGNPRKIEWFGYYADYDWVVFCWLFGRMIDLPSRFPMYCRDLKQMMDEMGLSKKWMEKHCPTPENEHNALSDACWHKSIHEAMIRSNPQKSVSDWKKGYEEWKKRYEEKARQMMNFEKQLGTANKKLIDAGL